MTGKWNIVNDQSRRWSIVNDQSNANYDVENEMIRNVEVLKSNFCDYNDAYIFVRGNINVIGGPETH